MNKKSLFTLFFVAVAVFFLCYDFPKDKEYQHRDGLVFGTVYSITYSNSNNQDLSQQITDALDAVNNSLSMFNKESVISKINNNQPVVLDSLFLTVWEKGQYVSRCTDGAFDMTVAPLVDLLGFGLKNREKVESVAVDSVRQYVGY
jgi:thiamine biosynthesis lipoprotein